MNKILKTLFFRLCVILIKDLSLSLKFGITLPWWLTSSSKKVIEYIIEWTLNENEENIGHNCVIHRINKEIFKLDNQIKIN